MVALLLGWAGGATQSHLVTVPHTPLSRAVALVGDGVERTSFAVEPLGATGTIAAGAAATGMLPPGATGLRIHYLRLDGATLVVHVRGGVSDAVLWAPPSPLPVLQRLCMLSARLRRSMAMASGGLLSMSHAAALGGYATFGDGGGGGPSGVGTGMAGGITLAGFDDVEGLTGSAVITTSVLSGGGGGGGGRVR